MNDEPFVLIGISSDADEAALRDFLVRHKADWPQVWDEGGRFAERCLLHAHEPLARQLA